MFHGPPPIDPVTLSLILLVVATGVLYVGNRLLWAAIPAVGLWRGVLMAVPVLAMAACETPASPGGGVAVLVAAAALAVTLGLGVSTLDDAAPSPDGLSGEPSGSPALRMLLPLAATVALAGFRGELPPVVALAIAVVGVLTLWTAAGERRPVGGEPVRAFPIAAGLPGVAVLAGGLALLLSATSHFRHGVGNAPLTPVVVLLTVPPLLLALIGLLAAEPRRHAPAAAHETVVGFSLACLGLGIPLCVLVGRTIALRSNAATRPDFVPVSMPISTWRIDAMLLLVVSLLLVPVGNGRLRLGRLEGFLLVGLYLAYAAVATRTGGLAG